MRATESTIDDVIYDWVSDAVEIEDHGIGLYDYGDGYYSDVRWVLALDDSECLLEYETDPEDCIPVSITGSYYVHDDRAGDCEFNYKAVLYDVQSMGVNCYKVMYEIMEA